jgi:hypothetical protein
VCGQGGRGVLLGRRSGVRARVNGGDEGGWVKRSDGAVEDVSPSSR